MYQKKFGHPLRYILFFLFGFVWFAFYYYNYVIKQDYHFNNYDIHSKITKTEPYYQKSIKFYYDKEYRITTTLTKGDTLFVGDSLVKEKGKNFFLIYRKSGKKYVLFKKYDMPD